MIPPGAQPHDECGGAARGRGRAGKAALFQYGRGAGAYAWPPVSALTTFCTSTPLSWLNQERCR